MPVLCRFFTLLLVTFSGALRWLLVFATVVALTFPVTRILTGLVVRGRVPDAPLAAEIRPPARIAVLDASPTETAAVREAVGQIAFPVKPGGFSIQVVDRMTLCEQCGGSYLYQFGLIRVHRRIVDKGGPGLRWTLAHEIGHYLDQRYFSASDRAEFSRIRGHPADRTWKASERPWNERPDEDFAEVFATLVQPQSTQPIATVYGPIKDPAPIERLLASARAKEGGLRREASIRELADIEWRYLLETVSDSRTAATLGTVGVLYMIAGGWLAYLRRRAHPVCRAHERMV